MNKVVLYIMLVPTFFFLSCGCQEVLSQDYISSEEVLRKNRFIKDTVYLLLKEDYLKKEYFKIKQPKVDFISGFIYTLKRRDGYLFWKYSERFLQIDEDGPYLAFSEEVDTIKASEIQSQRIVSPSLLQELEEEKIFQNLINKYLYVLEEDGICRYKRIPIGFGSGFFYSEKYE